MSNTGATSAFLSSGLASSPKLRKSYLPVHTPRAARSRHESFDGIADKTIKKSLVEEFYKKEAKSKQRSYSDISGSLTPVSLRPNVSSVQLEAEADEEVEEDTPPSAGDKIAAGKLQYARDRHVGFSEQVAEQLINLDRGSGPMTLSTVEEVLQAAIRGSARSHGVHTQQSSSEKELVDVERYLQQEHARVAEMQKELSAGLVLVKGRFRTKMQAGMEKVQQLRRTLETLSQRVAVAREKIAACRDVLLGTMDDRLAVMEDVCRRFEEYDRVNRQQRARYVTAAASALALAVVGYMVARSVLDDAR